MIIKKKIMVEVEANDLLGLLISAWYGSCQDDPEHSVLWCALSYLPGRTDIEAVKEANKWADGHEYDRIKVGQFRKWLPGAISQGFKHYLESKK